MMPAEKVLLCGKEYLYSSKKTLLKGPSFDLLAWIKKQTTFPKGYWKQKEEIEEIAVVGSLLSVNQPIEFCERAPREMRFWGGLSFFQGRPYKSQRWKDFPECYFFLPQMELIKKGEKTTLITHHLAPEETALREEKPLKSPTLQGWKELVDKALEKIDQGLFEKVVLAQEVSIPLALNIEGFDLLKELASSQNTLFGLQLSPHQVYLGASPEMLYIRQGSKIKADALAGTLPDTYDQDILINSSKDQKEFNYVKTSIENALTPLCKKGRFWEKDTVFKTSTLMHLYNVFSGVLKAGVSDRHLLNALHPTAALGGFPREQALNFIYEEEPFERGWYGGPLGYLSPKKSTFAVAIRSALLDKQTLHVFAGSGIVEGSTAEKEEKELAMKRRSWEKFCL